MKWISVKEQLPKTGHEDLPTVVKVRTNLGEGIALFSIKLKFHKINIQGIAAPEDTEVTIWQMP